MADLSRGDKVFWDSRNGRVHGKVVRKIERDTRIGDHTIRASKDNPQYLVESSRTGSRAAHKGDALTRE